MQLQLVEDIRRPGFVHSGHSVAGSRQRVRGCAATKRASRRKKAKPASSAARWWERMPVGSLRSAVPVRRARRWAAMSASTSASPRKPRWVRHATGSTWALVSNGRPARAEDGEAPPARRRQPRRQRRVDPVPGRHEHGQEAPAVKRPQPLATGSQLGKHGLYWTVAAVFRLLLLRSGMVPVAPAMLEDRARQVGGGLGRNDRKREGRALQSLDQPLQRGRPGLGIVVAPPEIRRFRPEVEFLRQRLPAVSPHFSPGSWSARCCRAGREGKTRRAMRGIGHAA